MQEQFFDMTHACFSTISISLILFFSLFTAACSRQPGKMNVENQQIKINIPNIEPFIVPPEDYPATVTAVLFYKENPRMCGDLAALDEAEVYRKTSFIDEPNERKIEFLVRMSICNNLIQNHSASLRDAKSAVYLSEIHDVYNKNYTVMLSLIATHELAVSDDRAWAYSRLSQKGLALYEFHERSIEKNAEMTERRQRLEVFHFWRRRTEGFKDKR